MDIGYGRFYVPSFAASTFARHISARTVFLGHNASYLGRFHITCWSMVPLRRVRKHGMLVLLRDALNKSRFGPRYMPIRPASSCFPRHHHSLFTAFHLSSPSRYYSTILPFYSQNIIDRLSAGSNCCSSAYRKIGQVELYTFLLFPPRPKKRGES